MIFPSSRLATALLFGLLLGTGSYAEEACLPPIDFSHAGYAGGGVSLPVVPAVVTVAPGGADDTARLQAALDHIGQLPLRPDGFRGAVLLGPGTFKVAGALRLTSSGVVLRGNGDDRGRSTIVATGVDRRTLIAVGRERQLAIDAVIKVTADAPVGTTELVLATTDGLSVGDEITVERPSTAEWIAALGMNRDTGNFVADRTHWRVGSRNLVWDRTITAIDAAQQKITFDGPITAALEAQFGGGTVARIPAGERIKLIGIERVTLESEFDSTRADDEEHAWIAIALNGVADAWVRDVTARHFVSSTVRVGPRARRVTIADCRSEQPVSAVAGYRRQSFYVEGQQVLVERCATESGLNDFGVGFCAAGPNVFLACVANRALGASGSYESGSAGTLFERVTIDGSALRLAYDMERTQGGGWTAANSVIWNCEAAAIDARGPAGAPVVVRTSIESLYENQLKRRGRLLAAGDPWPASERDVPEFQRQPSPEVSKPVRRLELVNGRFVVDGRVLWGGQFNAAWWKGQLSPAMAADMSGRSITRFAPGLVGRGLTEDLEQLADDLEQRQMPFYTGGPGLWYDRRRDDHLQIPRANADVWAPFYELPWARSGVGTAWDGLSKYDLSRFNPWYFSRMRAFARIAGERGLVVQYNLYNTHNILETFAHYTEYPWRAANCINDIGLTEPVHLDPNRTIHLSNVIYNVDHPGRRALHRAYIFHTLDELGDQPNAIFSLAFQFAGPLAFQQFFLDTVAEWEHAKGRSVRIALITSKDITDAIMADPVRSRQISVIDIRYWQRQADGTLWAPRGDVNRAFREQNAVLFGKAVDTPPDTTPLNVYKGVREYRDRFPDRPIIAWHGGAGPIPILMAGGAQVLMRNPAAGQSQGSARDDAALNHLVRGELAHALIAMRPHDGWIADADANWVLADDHADTVLVYSLAGATLMVADGLPPRRFRARWFDPRNGAMTPAQVNSTSSGAVIEKPSAQEWLLLLTAER